LQVFFCTLFSTQPKSYIGDAQTSFEPKRACWICLLAGCQAGANVSWVCSSKKALKQKIPRGFDLWLDLYSSPTRFWRWTFPKFSYF
jgi:hypothetical protein